METKPVLNDIKAVSFDLDDTLWHTAPVIQNAQAKIKQHLLDQFPRFNPETLDEEFRESLVLVRKNNQEILHNLTELRKLSFEVLLENYGYDPKLSDDLIEKFLHFRHEVRIYPDVEGCLKFLYGKFKLAALTSGNANVMRLEIGKYFDVHISAEQVDVQKPDRKIFDHVSNTLNIPHQHILHVGDNPIDDVQGALDAGFQAVWINRSSMEWPLDFQGHPEIRDLSQLPELFHDTPDQW